MRITVGYFALFREQAGCADEVVETTATTVAELFDEMKARHQELQSFASMKFARNDEIVTADVVIQDGDHVLFFPPVAGG